MTNPNDPAFSDKEIFVSLDINNQAINRMIGLTKREWFAGQALRGAIEWRDKHNRPENFDVKLLAQDCFIIADALIKEANKNG